jgi:hypothetical protein
VDRPPGHRRQKEKEGMLSIASTSASFESFSVKIVYLYTMRIN